MCTRRLPALKASQGPCLEGLLSGLQPGTVEHSSTARHGTAGGRSGAAEARPGAAGPLCARARGCGRQPGTPGTHPGGAGMLPGAGWPPPKSLRPQHPPVPALACGLGQAQPLAVKSVPGVHGVRGSSVSILGCPLQLGGPSNLPPSSPRPPRSPLLQCNAGPRLFWGLQCSSYSSPKPPTSGCFPAGTEQSPSPLHGCCRLMDQPRRCPALQSLPSTHGAAGAAGTCISPRETSGVFTNHGTQRHPNCQVL